MSKDMVSEAPHGGSKATHSQDGGGGGGSKRQKVGAPAPSKAPKLGAKVPEDDDFFGPLFGDVQEPGDTTSSTHVVPSSLTEEASNPPLKKPAGEENADAKKEKKAKKKDKDKVKDKTKDKDKEKKKDRKEKKEKKEKQQDKSAALGAVPAEQAADALPMEESHHGTAVGGESIYTTQSISNAAVEEQAKLQAKDEAEGWQVVHTVPVDADVAALIGNEQVRHALDSALPGTRFLLDSNGSAVLVKMPAEDKVAVDGADLLLQYLAVAVAGREVEGTPPDTTTTLFSVRQVPFLKDHREDVLTVLPNLLEQQGVIPALFRDSVELTEGMKCEAKYGNSFFEAEVVTVLDQGARVRFAYDNSEADVDKADIRVQKVVQHSPGDAVEAKYGHRFFPAEVLDVEPDGIKVKYLYDSSEAVVPVGDVKPQESAAPDTDKLYIFGDAKCLAQATRHLYCVALKGKAGIGSLLASLPDDPPDSHGLSVYRTAAAGLIIGPRGAQIRKLKNIAGIPLDIPCPKEDVEKFVVVAGTGEERQCAIELCKILVSSCKNMNEVPPVLEKKCYRISVPGNAIGSIVEEVRAPELDCVLVIITNTSDGDFNITVGETVDGNYNGKTWCPCEVVEVGEQVKVKWEYDSSESLLPRSDLRPRASSIKVCAVFAPESGKLAVAAKLLAAVESKYPGTYLANDGKSPEINVEADLQALVTEEVANAKAGSTSNWATSSWKDEHGGKDYSWGKQDDTGTSSDRRSWDNYGKWSWKAQGRSDNTQSWYTKPKESWSSGSWKYPEHSGQDQQQPSFPSQPSFPNAEQQPAVQPVKSMPSTIMATQAKPGASAPVDTSKALITYGFPPTVDDWANNQHVYFGGHPVLPSGWIRVWSRSKSMPYFVRRADNHSTFDWQEMMQLSGRA